MGIRGGKVTRNTPSIFNVGYQSTFFWDGRAGSLEEQVLMSIQSEVEMHQSLEYLKRELKSQPDYREMFESAFADSEITPERIAMAIATFERTLITSETAYDRYWQGEKKAMSPAAIRGMKLFSGKAKCSICHNGPLFTDHQFHDIGLQEDKENIDKGRKNISGEIFHEGAFKTPGLRGVVSTDPYMHDGSLPDLRSVIDFYNQGGILGERKSPFISPIDLNENDKNDLLEFLISLDMNERNYKTQNQEIP